MVIIVNMIHKLTIIQINITGNIFIYLCVRIVNACELFVVYPTFVCCARYKATLSLGRTLPPWNISTRLYHNTILVKLTCFYPSLSCE